jgi:hypothetical protein
MQLEHWLIFGLAGVGLLLLFFYLHRRSTAGAMGPERKFSGPTPDDKYLPVWVILCMSFAVLVLSYQMTSVIKDGCATSGKCDSGSSPDGTPANQTVGDAPKKTEASAKPKTDIESKPSEAGSAAASTTTGEPATTTSPAVPKPKTK